MTRRSTVCQICYGDFIPDNERGAPPRRCSKPSCQRAAGPSDEHGVHDDWGEHFTDSLQQLAARICQKDPEAFLKQVAELRDLTEDLTRVAIFKARMRHNMSWGDIGRILNFDGKTVSKRWAPGDTLRRLYRKFGKGSLPEDGALSAVVRPEPVVPSGDAKARLPSTENTLPKYFLRTAQVPLDAGWPPPSWPTWPAAVWPAAAIENSQPGRSRR